MFTGWFPIDRQLLASDLWLGEKFSRGQAWVDLVGLARFKPGYVRLRGKRVDLARGQLAWSQRELARRWRWGPRKVNGLLKELQADGWIDYQNVGVTTVITLRYYDAPHALEAPPAPPATTPTNQSPPTKEQGQQSQQRQPAMDAWGDMEGLLKDLGINSPGNAIESARRLDLSPADVRQWIDEYRDQPGAWGPGALVARMTGKLTEWPPPSDEFQRQQARRQSARDLARQVAARTSRREAWERQQEREQQLEREYGPVLDGLDETELAALEFRTIPDASERALSRRLPTAHRGRLLLALAGELERRGVDVA